MIADGARPDRVRDLALDIATACESREVAIAAADLALHATAAIPLRASAARAVAATGDATQAERLRPLALGSEDQDEMDELKGSALRATWRAISSAELFAALARARRPNMSGAYELFLGELADAFPDSAVVPGLDWLERIGHAASPGEQRLEATVILRAFERLDEADVAQHLLPRVRRELARYEPLLANRDERAALVDLLRDPAVRHRLLTALVDDVVARASASGERGTTSDDQATAIGRRLDARTLAYSGYLSDDDMVFVLESLERVGDSTEWDAHRVAWGQLALGMFDIDRAEHANAVLERMEVPNVQAVFHRLVEPVQLDSPEVEAARWQVREREAQERQWAAEHAQYARQRADSAPPMPPLPSAERLAAAIDAPAEADRPDDLPRRRWLDVFIELARDENGQVQTRTDIGALQARIAWRDASPGLRGRVVDCAARFVESVVAPVLDPEQDVHYDEDAWAGYTALRLMDAEAPDRLDRLDADAWERWAPTIALVDPDRDGVSDTEAHLALAQRARVAAPHAFDHAVLDAVQCALAKAYWRVPHGIVSAFAATTLGERVLARCLDAIEVDVREAKLASNQELSADVGPVSDVDHGADRDGSRHTVARDARKATLVQLLSGLLEGGSDDARVRLTRMIDPPAPLAALAPESPDADRALIAAHALLVGSDDGAWRTISALIDAAPALGRELFLRSARHREVPIRDFRERLGVRGVGEMFVALATAFPLDTDPWHVGVYSPGARDNVMMWRHAMLNALERWGTTAAIVEILRIQEALPQYDWLAYSVARAREHAGRSAWCPATPLELFTLADDRRRRLVRDGDELLELIVESLGRYQRELQRDLPAVADLWDYSRRDAPRPRDEGHFADHVARFLRQDLEGRGLAIGCELVIRRGGNGRAPGLRTDIHVTATLDARTRTAAIGETTSVVIEVKGSWHDEVLSAMRTQLVDDYLREHAGTRRGIYLVGDFSCDAWADDTALRRSRSLGGVAALQARLDAQAAELSRGGVRVAAVVLDTSLPA